MEQKKVTESERAILKKMAHVGSYINTGTINRPMCSVMFKGIVGIQQQFQPRTLIGLKLKGLIDGKNEITQKGEEVAIKGFYTE